MRRAIRCDPQRWDPRPDEDWRDKRPEGMMPRYTSTEKYPNNALFGNFSDIYLESFQIIGFQILIIWKPSDFR
jgi:hypothetical protein